jgi:hypothetical protein
MTRWWTEADSDALDRQIREMRKPRRQPPPVGAEEARRVVAAGTRYIASELPVINGAGRRPGLNTKPPPVPLHPALVVQGQPPKPEPPPTPLRSRPGRQPRVYPARGESGRWTARSGYLDAGQRTFDTEAEAQAWLDQLQKEQ